MATRQIKTLYAQTGSLTAAVAVTAPSWARAGNYRVTQIHIVNQDAVSRTFLVMAWGTTFPGGNAIVPTTTLLPFSYRTINVNVPLVSGDTVEVTQVGASSAILITGEETVG